MTPGGDVDATPGAVGNDAKGSHQGADKQAKRRPASDIHLQTLRFGQHREAGGKIPMNESEGGEIKQNKQPICGRFNLPRLIARWRFWRSDIGHIPNHAAGSGEQRRHQIKRVAGPRCAIPLEVDAAEHQQK